MGTAAPFSCPRAKKSSSSTPPSSAPCSRTLVAASHRSTTSHHHHRLPLPLRLRDESSLAPPTGPTLIYDPFAYSGVDWVRDGCCGLSRCAGIRRVNVEPVPGLLQSWTSPPWEAATCLTIANPNPVPPVARLRV